MPTASKSADIIRMEGKSHRTKKELRQREQAEKALLTGIPLKERQEVKDNEIAHKEFLRLKKLLEKINKFDDMYGAVINRYCILYAETKEFEEKRDQFYNDNNVMIDEIDIAKKTLDGLLDDRRYFALLYEPDDDLKQGEAWQTDDRAIYQSNPVAVSHQYIFDEIKKKRTLAVLYENKRENYLCKHNNILYKGLGVEGYVDIQKVKLCRIQPDPQWWNGRQVWVGVDLSQTDDNTAVAMVTEDNGYIYARVMGFIPKEKINIKTQKEHVDYQRMISKGECIACGEEVIDYSVVENYVIHLLEEEYGVIVEQVGYDRYNAISSVQKMEAEGLECVEIKQHSSVLHQPTKWLKELILQQVFRYEENRLLEINFQNARCTEDTNLNKYVNKKKSTGKVDEVVALINAMYLLQQYLLNGDNFVAQTA